MKTVSANNHLLRRNGVYYYRRRVPTHLVAALGRQFVQLSLDTTSLTQAKKLRTVKDLEWDAQFEAAEKKAAASQAGSNSALHPTKAPVLSEREVVELVRDYVERMDERFRGQLTDQPPESEQVKADLKMDDELDIQILRNRDDLQADMWISKTGEEILEAAGESIDDPAIPQAFWGLVRRALLELHRRSLARLQDDHRPDYFDQLFNPARTPQVTFGELADQYLDLTKEDAVTNGASAKWIDKVKANVALIREIIGAATPIQRIDYDACLRVRSMLARLPANRTKIYGGMSLEQAIERAAAEKRDLLSPVTQAQYLAALRDVLDLGAKKRLIAVNPAEGMRPLKRDTVPDAEKRLPFTLGQIRTFFASDFYAESTKQPPPYAHDKSGWRFWLPLICLFMGMRPNEAAQMHVQDVKRTSKGTPYLDIISTADDDASDPAVSNKMLKTATSRRKIPLHPELIAIGFLQFLEDRKKSGSTRLFPDLKPDKYGNHAWYPLKRFNETYLPKAIKLEPRQSFYSFRHSWRDALRRIDAPPDALQALGGWKQGKLTSDNYGDASDPDYQAQYLSQIAFPGLDLSGLYRADVS
jgi:integrase